MQVSIIQFLEVFKKAKRVTKDRTDYGVGYCTRRHSVVDIETCRACEANGESDGPMGLCRLKHYTSLGKAGYLAFERLYLPSKLKTDSV